MHLSRFTPPLFPAAALCLALLLVTASAGEPSTPPEATLTETFRAHVTALAADDMEGRGLGTAGLERAAVWIEAALTRIPGFKPAFDTGYRQPFPVKTGVRLADGNQLDGVGPGDWTPLGFSSSGSFEGEVAFVGYGLALWEISIWYRRGWALTLKSNFDALLYGLLTGGVFGWLWPQL